MPRSGPQTVTEQHAARRPAGARVDDVGAALVGPRRRDREAARRGVQHGGRPARRGRVLDADAPRAAGRPLAEHADVAPRVHAQVPGAGRAQDRDDAVDRPALHEPRRVQAPGGVHVEAPAGGVAQALAAREHRPHLGPGRGDRERARGDPADIARRPVRAERRVDGAQVGERAVEDGGVDAVVADVHPDRDAHDGLHAVQAAGGERLSHGAPCRSPTAAPCGSCGSCRSRR